MYNIKKEKMKKVKISKRREREKVRAGKEN